MAKNTREVSTLVATLLLSWPILSALAQNPLTDIPAGDEGMVTGPEIGGRIPDFEALNQNRAFISFDDIKGPNGAIIVFQRSADW